MPGVKKQLRRGLRYFTLICLLVFCIYAGQFVPIITGQVAKTMCSGIFVSRRSPAAIDKEDFSFPFSWVSYRVDLADSSVSTSFWGMARRKAIFRNGLGATLLSEITEAQLELQTFVLAPSAPFSQDTVDWPMGDRTRDTPVLGANQQALTNVIREAFKAERGPRALLIIYKGQIIAERYAPGFTARMPLTGWSMTKSIFNAVAGTLVREGRLDTAAPASMPGWENDRRKDITIAQLMQMTSGLHFFWFPLGPSDVTNMLFKARDMAAFAAREPLRHPPGSVWNYSDGNANILSGVIRRKLGDSLYYRWPYEQLLYKIGMFHTVLEPDAAGNFVASSYCYATARDWARFGLLYLNDGVWNGQRLLPRGWVRWSTTHNKAKWGYGALWWTDKDWFACEGYDGQYVYVVPSKQLVIVRLSLEKSFWQPGILVKAAMEAVQ